MERAGARGDRAYLTTKMYAGARPIAKEPGGARSASGSGREENVAVWVNREESVERDGWVRGAEGREGLAGQRQVCFGGKDQTRL